MTGVADLSLHRKKTTAALRRPLLFEAFASTAPAREPSRKCVLRVDGGRSRAQLRVQRRTDGVHRSDDHDRDAGRDKTILNGRRAGLVAQKPRNKFCHWEAPA